MMSRATNYFKWQARLVLPELGRRVLELGCGTGNFTSALLDREAVIAVDIEADCIEQLKRRHRNRANLSAFVISGRAECLKRFAAFRPDCCVCLNVLEHIEDDRATLNALVSALTPGGRIVLLVPAFPSLYGPIDAALGHCRRYTRQSLHALAQGSGLNLIKAHYVNLPGFFGWWMNSHIFRRQAQSPVQITIFDRYIVPLSAPMERAIRPPFGQSLFAVLAVG
jgi:2-polyprenyl-3-methyl-5-hydroxy-6-metoxy-1,4-benzoquinol methylase